MRRIRFLATLGLLFVSGVLQPLHSQGTQGKSIGKVTTRGDIIVVELNEGAVVLPSLFDLEKRTLRFTPERGGYRAENLPLIWDAEFGTPVTGIVALRNFTFPFSGKSWTGLNIGTGTIGFTDAPAATAADAGRGGAGGGRGAGGGGGGGGRGGLPVDRFAELREAASTVINTSPAISAFLKPRMTGQRFVKELADRVVVTWTLTEPSGGIFDFTWVPTVNRFQAVLRKDGSIELSYDQLAAKDAIVGIYPVVNTGVERAIASVSDAAETTVPEHLDIRSVKASVVDGIFFKVTIETRGPALAAATPLPAGGGFTYRVHFDADRPLATAFDSTDTDLTWTIRAAGPGGRGGGGGGGRAGAAPAGLTYSAQGDGVQGNSVKVVGNTISFQGSLPAQFKGVAQIAVSADVIMLGTPATIIDQVSPAPVSLASVRRPDVDFSSVKKSDGPFPIIYEAFHYASIPRYQDVACTVISALGDKFDFLVPYADFRVDNQEAGSPSNGPLGHGATGFANRPSGRPANYCSQGRFEWTYTQPVYIGSVQGQERSPDGSMVDYNYAMSQVGHELGHTWAAFGTALVKGERIALGPTHFATGLHQPAAFPYRRGIEASTMGGSVWQDNFDGTFTQLDDAFFVPATGRSHLELYYMGLMRASEVPDFFILRNMVRQGSDAQGHPIYKADPVKITIQDVIAADGPRTPDYDNAQKNFNTGFLALVLPGQQPSQMLLTNVEGIRKQWIHYWSVITGYRSVMTTSPR